MRKRRVVARLFTNEPTSFLFPRPSFLFFFFDSTILPDFIVAFLFLFLRFILNFERTERVPDYWTVGKVEFLVERLTRTVLFPLRLSGDSVTLTMREKSLFVNMHNLLKFERL